MQCLTCRISASFIIDLHGNTKVCHTSHLFNESIQLKIDTAVMLCLYMTCQLTL